MIFQSRKSQGMPINVIIIAALALMVLVILAFFFSGKIGSISGEIDSCEAKQGKCQPNVCGPNQAQITGKCKNKDNKDEGYCCATITPAK